MTKWTLLFSIACLMACDGDPKKRVGSCADDGDCEGGVCWAESCYTACSGQVECASDEFCVARLDGVRSVKICLTAADHAGCISDQDCADLVRGPCETIPCDFDRGVCAPYVDTGCQPDDPVPVFGAWRTMPTAGAPAARNYVTGAWTGTRMCLWGGFDGSSLGDGACYVAADDAWVALPAENAPSARCLMPETWAGDRFCTWAGYGGGSSGSCWLEASETWEAMPEVGAPSTPRQNHGAAWTGSELCVFGGRTVAGGTDLADGGCYDPVANSWKALPSTNAPAGGTNPSVMWVGDRLCVWGGWTADAFTLGGACWTPGAESWEPILPDDLLPPFVEARPAGDRFCAWGGSLLDGSEVFSGGACYHPASATWRALPTADAPAARGNGFAAAWTGDWWCLYGGVATDEAPAVGGACYSPALDRWFPMPEAGAVPIGVEATGFWTGTEFCAWGGRLNGQNQQAGACLAIEVGP